MNRFLRLNVKIATCIASLILDAASLSSMFSYSTRQLIRAQARQNRDFSRFSPQPLLFHTQLCHHNVVLSSPPMAIGHGGLKLILIQEGRSLACILQALHSAQLCGTQMHPVRPYEGLLPSRFLTPMVLLFLAPAVRLFMMLEINDRCFAASD